MSDKNPSGMSLLRNCLSRPYVRRCDPTVKRDREVTERRRRDDGKFVPRANTELTGSAITLACRQL